MSQPSLTAGSGSPKRLPWRRLGLLGAGGLLVVLAPDLPAMFEFVLRSLWDIAPLMAMGLTVTAVLTATGAVNRIVGAFSRHELVAVAAVSAIGSVLPVCGVTVLPLVAGLLAAGVSLAPVMAFLLSSAVTDPQIFAVTTATLGLGFALAKTVAALGIGLGAGGLTWLILRAGGFADPLRQSGLLGKLCGVSGACAGRQFEWRFWRECERRQVLVASWWSMAKLAALFLSGAFAVEFWLVSYLPPESLAGWLGGDSGWAIPVAALVGTPLYVDGYAALPLVRGLMERGMAEGAAMAFLVAGGMTSAWTALPVLALFRLPVFVFYVAAAAIGAMLAGWVFALVA